MRSFLLALLVATACLATDGANDKVLANGNPPLTRGMVGQLAEVFGWLMNGTFSSEQEIQLRDLLADYWRSADAASLSGYVKLLEMRPQIAQMAADSREQLRQKLETATTASLASSGDGLAKLLMAVRGQGRLNPASSNATGAPGGNTPSTLLGTWGAGHTSATTYVGTRTGSYAPPSGTQVQYTFQPNSRYEFAMLTTQSTYNCTMKIMVYKTGSVIFQGDTLTFVPESAKMTSQDSCNAGFNYEKPFDKDRETYRWRVERDQSGVKMCLENAKVNGCAYKR